MADPVKFAVLTVSDRSALGQRADESGPRLQRLLEETLNSACYAYQVVPDDHDAIVQQLCSWSDVQDCQLICTTGGTGLSPRDITPDATRSLIDRPIPGIAEAIRAAGQQHTPLAMLSRGVVGQRSRTLIINFSGSPRAVDEQFAVVAPVLRHALDVLAGSAGDCAR